MFKSKLKTKVKTKSGKKSKQCKLPPPPQELEDDTKPEAEESIKNETKVNNTEIPSKKQQPVSESDNEPRNLESSVKRNKKTKSPKKSKQEPQESEDEAMLENTAEESANNAEPEVDNDELSSTEDQPLNGNHYKDDDDEMDLGNLERPKRKRKKGIIYISNIPKHMNVTRIREILGEYGKIGRVYLQPEKAPGWYKKNKRKPYLRHFTEGWVEFLSKRVAKQIVPMLNNKNISTRKTSQFYDYIWTMKYLPRFKWVHLTERMNYEQAVHKQRMMNEVSQARKETTFFQNNLDKSEYLKKKNKKNKKAKAEESD